MLRKLDELELRLGAPEGSVAPREAKPEKRAVLIEKGVKKLRRAAQLAPKASAPRSRALAAELSNIAACIESRGMAAETVAALHPMVGVAVAVEAETGAPVAHRLSEAVDRFRSLYGRTELSPAQWVQQVRWKRRFLPRSPRPRSTV
jgi:hypothetical protein